MYGFIIQSLAMLYFYRGALSQFMPGSYPMAGHQMPMRMPMPGMPGAMPPMMSMAMQSQPMPFQMAGQPGQKLPVVVMPYYSKTANKRKDSKRKRSANKKKRRSRPKYFSSSSETSASCDSISSEDSSENYRSSRRTKLKPRRQVLTPVVSYVTKDGYVIYQKKIRNDKARDLIQLGDKDKISVKSNEVLDSDDEGHVHVKRRSRSSHHH